MRRFIIFFALAPLAVKAQDNGVKTSDNSYCFSFGGTSSGFADIGWVPGCDGDNAVKAITDDGSVVGEYSITTDGEQASWEHVELNLVDADGLMSETIDLSDEASQNIQVTFSADQDAQVLFMLTDKTTVDHTNGWQVAADNNPAIQYDYLSSEGEMTITNETDSYDGNDLANGSLDWKVFNSPGDASTVDLYVDSTAISEVWVYYRSKDVTTNCGSSVFNVTGTLTIKSIIIGDYTCGVDGVVSKEGAFDAYPNPATTTVNFSKILDVVKLYNVDGELLETHYEVESLSTSHLESGMYMLQTNEGYKRFTIK